MMKSFVTAAVSVGLFCVAAVGQNEPPALDAKVFEPLERPSPTVFALYAPEAVDEVVSELAYLTMDISAASMFAGMDALDKPDETAVLVARARKLLGPLIVDPTQRDVDVWRCVGGLALVTDDAELAGYAMMVLGAIEQTEENVGWLEPMLARLGPIAMPINVTDYERARIEFFDALEASRTPAGTQGRAKAFGAVAAFYEKGRFVPTNLEEAFHWYTLGAEAGDALSQDELGVMYSRGTGCEQDYAEAFKWFKRSADAGMSWGMSDLGLCYEAGYGVEKDEVQAIHWYRKSAEAGQSQAMFNLALLRSQESGSVYDPEQAMEWFGKAADAGRADAMVQLGFAYFNGTLVEEDVGLAMSWYIKAGRAGSVYAMWSAAVIYATGNKVDRNMESAAQWMQLAAQHGHAEAMYNYGVYLYTGTGVAQDQDAAIGWIEKAAAAGDAQAIEAMTQIRPPA